MRTALRLFAGAIATAVVLTGCGGGDDSGGGEPGGAAELTIAIASAVIGPKEEVAAYAVAQELGYFEDENLTVNTINADGSVAAL